MNALMIVLLSILGTALFITAAVIIDVLMRWYFAMNRHIELLSGVKAQLQELKEKEAQTENRTDVKYNGKNGSNGNGKEKQSVSALSSTETKAALENSLEVLQKLESLPRIWPSIEAEYNSKSTWVMQEKN